MASADKKTDGATLRPGKTEPAQAEEPVFTFSENGLTVRPFRTGDEIGVRKLVFSHVRSQVQAAVKFWIFRNFSHVAPIFAITFFFVTWTQMFFILFLTLLYLVGRSWYEMEMYIRYSCNDLKDIKKTYLDDKSKHFWVAEFDPSVHSSPTRKKSAPAVPAAPAAASKPSQKIIVGCIGLVPFPEDTKRMCQVYRLVVDPTQRRLKVGSHLLAALEDEAKARMYSEVRMIANNLHPATHHFYRRNGYDVLQYTQRSLMRGDLIAYRKMLVAPSAPASPVARAASAQQDAAPAAEGEDETLGAATTRRASAILGQDIGQAMMRASLINVGEEVISKTLEEGQV